MRANRILLFHLLCKFVERRSFVLGDTSFSHLFQAIESLLVEISVERATDISFDNTLHLTKGILNSINFPIRYHLLKIRNRVHGSNLLDGVIIAIFWSELFESGCLLLSHRHFGFLLSDLELTFLLNSFFLVFDDVPPVDSLLFCFFLAITFVILYQIKCIFKLLNFFLCVLLNFGIWLQILQNILILFRNLIGLLWVDYFVRDNLIKVLNRRIKSLLWL